MSENGDYKICWDNTFSHFNSKTVFFGLVVESEDEEDQEALWGAGGVGNTYEPEELYEMKVEDIKVIQVLFFASSQSLRIISLV